MPSFERDYELIFPMQGLGAKIVFVKQNNLIILSINILEKLLCQSYGSGNFISIP